VAFDVARTARRLGGAVSLVCLECEDKSSKDGIPADVEEIEGASEEGIKIVYSRGVEEIVGKNGKFTQIKCPKCTSVWDDYPGGRFNPQFDRSDVIRLEGEVLLITIGQASEREFFQKEGLLNEKGRLDVDPVTFMSNLKPGVFIGGDVRRVGFASEAMRDGATAADSIERWLKHKDMKAGREKEYESAPAPRREEWKPQPRLAVTGKKLNFEPFEKGFDLKEALEEARRCLYCGPCQSCKGCVVAELQPEIPEIEVNQDICSGCGVCVAVCSYDATSLKKTDKGLTSVIDDNRCKRCGLCVSACPAGARSIKDNLEETIAAAYATIRQ
jgi:NADPH-dependent glutamate synthase beta subunit-like oxidoreductase